MVTSKPRSKATIARTMNKIGKFYFLTIRKHQVKDFVGEDDLLYILEQIQIKLPTLIIGPHSFEIDSKYRQLHFHAMVNVFEYFKYTDISSVGGYRLYWRGIYNQDSIIKYINKDHLNNKIKQHQTLITNYYQHPKSPYRFP